jgi:prepilin-type N-terminal cleavage/methylation domain-containing protein
MNRGFSLLEVILSLAILAGSLAALGEVMRQADSHSSHSGEETQGQVIASSIMDEILSGYRSLTSVGQTVYDPNMDPPWQYTITVENTAYAELLAIHVLVEQQLPAQLRPARYELVRWAVNPSYYSTETDTETETGSDSSSSDSSNSSNDSSSGSSTFGGGTGGGP